MIKGTKILSYWRGALVVVLAIFFALGASYFNYKTQSGDFIKWVSPDETANYIFTKLYAQEGRIYVPEHYNMLLKDIVHPRSFMADQGQLKPMSFLGITLFYGTIAHLTTYKIIPFLTPIMAAIGIIFFYLLIKNIFDRSTALLSSFLLAVFPIYIYYSSRSMFHNVLFFVFTVISLYFFVLMNQRQIERVPGKTNFDYQGWGWAALAGLFLSGAIATRTSELLWLGPVLGVLWLFNIRRTGVIKLAIVITVAVLAYIPVLHWNTILYGAAWHTGYPQMNNSIVNIGQASGELVKNSVTTKFGEGRILWSRLVNTVFYFGIKPKQSLKLFINYLRLYSWLAPLAFLGFAYWSANYKEITKGQAAYMVCLAIASAALIVYYGSWDFHDNPDATKITIGNSYTRYWLPIYAGLLPLAAYFIVRVSRFLRRDYLVWPVRVAILLIIAYLGIHQAWAGSDEGLKTLIAKNENARYQWQVVLDNTERNAVIITRYHDKLIFPERKVILGLFDDDNMIHEFAHMTKLLPTYYYNFTLPEKDMKYLNQTRLKKNGLSIVLVKQVDKDFSLYKLVLLK